MNAQPLVPDTDPHRLAAAIGGHNLIAGQLVRAASGRSGQSSGTAAFPVGVEIFEQN